MEREAALRRTRIYLSWMAGFLGLSWIAIISDSRLYIIVWGLFSVFPVLAVILTRLHTKDHSPWLIGLKIKQHWKSLAMAAFLPGLLIFLGALFFFLVFPNDLDLSARYIVQNYSQFGAPETLAFTYGGVFLVGIAFIFISPFVLPVHLFALGEEIGWRGYLLPQLLILMDQKRAVLVHGLCWGVAHAVLIYFGFNYSSQVWGAPYTTILMMILVCVVLGIWLGYLTIRTNSILPAVIFHGAGNVIGEIPAMFSIGLISPLIGPNPTGLIGVSVLLIGSIYIYRKLDHF